MRLQFAANTGTIAAPIVGDFAIGTICSMVSLPQNKCCGCTACQFVCPKQCISMQADDEGFLYPQVNADSCSNCLRCEKVCPALNQTKNPQRPVVFACYNKDADVRKQSSSGGLFSLIANQVLKQGGIVFGAAFDGRFEVEHRFVDSPQELGLLRGAKYVQSRLGDTFKQVKEFLNEGRLVLFTGTPCQVAGLKKGLGKNYSNLLTADIVCHGVPSPLVFRLYREEMEQRFQSPIKSFSFRNKTHGWQNYHVFIEFESETSLTSLWEDDFMRGFLSDMYLRPSCHACCADDFRSGSDLTLADYWGVDHFHPELFDDQGTSLVLLHTEKGKEYWRKIEPMLEYRLSELSKAVQYNPCLVQSVGKHPKRRLFFERLGKVPFGELIADILKPDQSFTGRLKRLVRQLLVNRYTKYVYHRWFRKS